MEIREQGLQNIMATMQVNDIGTAWIMDSNESIISCFLEFVYVKPV